MDLRKFLDMRHQEGQEPESHGRAWQEEELREKGWTDLHQIWHLSVMERNLLLTEMAWKRVPKTKQEQLVLSIPRGHSKETDAHRLRYNEIIKTLRRIKAVMRARAQQEPNPIKRQEILASIMAR